MGIGENERYVTQNHNKAEEPVQGNESRKKPEIMLQNGPLQRDPPHTLPHVATCTTERVHW